LENKGNNCLTRCVRKKREDVKGWHKNWERKEEIYEKKLVDGKKEKKSPDGVEVLSFKKGPTSFGQSRGEKKVAVRQGRKKRSMCIRTYGERTRRGEMSSERKGVGKKKNSRGYTVKLGRCDRGRRSIGKKVSHRGLTR